MTPDLVDAPARARITEQIGCSLFVEAGAGSGKTSSLVNRIVTLVDSGVPVPNIAAITFTEAAARELRTRVRDALIERGHDGGVVESAAFTTLHGFALRILSDFPIEAGLPPGFGVVDEVTSALQFERDWRMFEGRLGDDMRLLELQQRANALGIKLKSFSAVARQFDDNWDLLLDRDVTATVHDRGPAPDLVPLAFDEVVADALRLDRIRAGCISDDDALSAGIVKLVAQVEPLVGQSPLKQLLGLGGLPWPPRKRGRKGNWRGPTVEEARAEVDAVHDRVDVALAAVVDDTVRQLTALVAGHVLERVEHRRTAGLLSFHDLLVLTRRLLRSDELVRTGLHHRYRYLLLDEFQDTDPIQIELAVLVASTEPVGSRPWPELAQVLEPGRLVVVGDPKQAIYRFRRADMAVYAETEKVLVPETTRLVSNFRSVPGIVEWINAFFTRVMGEGQDAVQPPYVPLSPVRRPAPGGRPPVVVLGGPHDKEELNVGQLRQREAEDVAALVCRVMEESWPVWRNDEWLPARLSDIAVLIPSRLSLPALEAAFVTAGIPFRPETNSLVYSTQEVRDVLAAVRAVVDPTSTIDVVAALRSALFAVADDHLLAWKLAGGGFDYRDSRVPDGQHRSPLIAAFGQLAQWHAARWWAEPAVLVERMVRERRLRELALAEARPRDRWRRYRFLAEQAREFTETQGGDLQDFVDWVEIQSSDIARITEPVPPEPDDEAVRVLTVHGSKGLEFPIAVLAGAPSMERSMRAGPTVIFGPDGDPEVKIGGDNRTEGFDARASVEDVLDANERIRLQYVAATRARDYLAVCVHHNNYGTSTGRRSWEVIGDIPELWALFERRGDERFQLEPPHQLSLPGAGFVAERESWLDQHRRLAAESGPARWTATELADLLAARRRQATPSAGRQRPLGPEPTTSSTSMMTAAETGLGPVFGDAVHAALQMIDFDRPEVVDRVAAAAAVRFGIRHLAAEIAGRVRAALESKTVQWARHLDHWRELDVAVSVGDGLLEGVIDLVVDGPDGLVVIDYKTDALGPEPATALEAKAGYYRHQLAAYALALGRLTDQPVVDCRLLFLTPDRAIEYSIPDPATAVADVEAHLAVS